MNQNGSPDKTSVWTTKIEFCCSRCQTHYQLASFFNFLTNFKKLRDSKFCKGLSDCIQNNQYSPDKFKAWIEVLGKEEVQSVQQKVKKIKKRGRKKWTSRHDLILEGSILIWGDEVSKLRKLMPEFNENVIRKKLNHFLWKKYAVKKDCLQISEVIGFNLTGQQQKLSEPSKETNHENGTRDTSLQQTATKEFSNDSRKHKVHQWLKHESAFNFTLAKMPEHSRDCFDFNQDFKNRTYIESIADLSEVLNSNIKDQIFREQNFQNSELHLYKNSAFEIGSMEQFR